MKTTRKRDTKMAMKKSKMGRQNMKEKEGRKKKM